ncbi:hypothetical protein GGR55DRAFT_672827 [Xylaria sp. FL0064]|nr:hypothetical protein GGR55DRAFT_672827 [Xylaria sp. FL0064]
MENRRRAQSLLEFLTAKNPLITPVDGNGGLNGSRLDYYCPKAVKPWAEFDYEAIETMYGGELIKEAKKKRRNLPHYPHLDAEIDLRLVKGEPTTRSLFNKWNHTIVLASLREVQDVFYPCLWREKTGETPSEGKGAIGAKKAQKGIRKQRSKRSRQPDGGSVSMREVLLKKPQERFPKEYKSTANWSSKKLRDGKYTNKETGEWLEEVKLIVNNNIAPIRQAYTYCINYGCRYGCILTTSEAFIFRIKPRGSQKVSIDDDPSSYNQLLKTVKNDGLMEFVSIPWGNGCNNHHHDYKSLTVNLALWFAHILAGNHYKLDWNYRKLHEEELVHTPQQQEHQPKLGDKMAEKNDGESLLSRTRTAGNKRKHHEYTQSEVQQESQDVANFSFYDNPLPQPTVPATHYAAGTQYDSEVNSDEDSPLPPTKRRLRSTSQQSESEPKRGGSRNKD